MLLCMLTASNVLGYEADFRLIPYLIGALYGGWPTLAFLSGLYIVLRIPMLDSVWEMVSFGLFLAIFIPLILLAVRQFQRDSAEHKRKKALLIMTGMMLYYLISMKGYITVNGEQWTSELFLTLFLSTIVTLMAIWLSIFKIESVQEKMLLYDEVKRISINYRNEVEKLQQFIDETSFGVIFVDGEGKITHFNEIAKSLLSLQPKYKEAKELLGTPFPLVFVNEEGDTCVNMLYQALNGERSSHLPLVNGEKMLLLTSFSLRMSLSEQNSGAALIAQDVTELRHLQDEVGRMERLSLVGQMAASITHEIRNPMAVIRGFVQLIQERSPENQEEYFRIVIEELDRANMIISDFLSLAQNRVLVMELSSLHEVIHELVPLLHADANLRGQQLEVSLCEQMPLIMMNDREIKQLFLNIARNGMEAMGNKGSLHISTRHAGSKVELRIADEGIGIPPEQMKHLFEPFFSTKTQGTGLGLPLCLSIAERHNGRIDVESQEGNGTVFIVTFFLPEDQAS
ncbi:two-component system sensor histidine kinase NtrB [Paenibacillus sinopodophylli]|uniref:two-component system sensor histidine kinase NtrB n=1 Tax=Paenibacillus sinopodophylli TaxID=1837342 RepID=UPI001FE6053F|nr:ATP-binding protein [Paenibacillus sinopodophylli]